MDGVAAPLGTVWGRRGEGVADEDLGLLLAAPDEAHGGGEAGEEDELALGAVHLDVAGELAGDEDVDVACAGGR